MKTIGLIGGMSWESTVTYYRIINKVVKERLGGLNSAKIILYSFNFDAIERLQSAGKWKQAGQELARAAVLLQNAGANFLVIATNTMHRVAADVERAVDIPLLHIAAPTADAVRECGLSKVGLLGTRFTMEQDFYKKKLSELHAIEVVIPGEDDRQLVHKVIFEELCRGAVLEESRREFVRIIRQLADMGAGGVILGCTEISMLVAPQDSPAPLFDTTEIHALRAAEQALED